MATPVDTTMRRLMTYYGMLSREAASRPITIQVQNQHYRVDASSSNQSAMQRVAETAVTGAVQSVLESNTTYTANQKQGASRLYSQMSLVYLQAHREELAKTEQTLEALENNGGLPQEILTQHKAVVEANIEQAIGYRYCGGLFGAAAIGWGILQSNVLRNHSTAQTIVGLTTAGTALASLAVGLYTKSKETFLPEHYSTGIRDLAYPRQAPQAQQ